MATDPKDLPENFTFAPLVEFDGPWGTYYPGNSYNCTQAQKHNALREKCAEWLDAGRIRIFAVPNGFRTTTVTRRVKE